MAINQIKIDLEKDLPVTRIDNTLELGSGITQETIDVNKIHVRFNGHYHIEVKQKDNDVLITMTSGGLSKEIDLQTFQQMITMNY